MRSFTTKDQINRFLKYIVWSILLLASTLVIFYFCYIEYSRYTMKAMNCKTQPLDEFNKDLAEWMAMPMYSADPSGLVSPITFHFNLAAELLPDTIFVIESNKVRRLIYRAPYQNEFTIQAGQGLLRDKGGDSFKFLLFNKKKLEICVDEHGSTRYWQAGKQVYIDFLPFRELDSQTGEPVALKVRIE